MDLLKISKARYLILPRRLLALLAAGVIAIAGCTNVPSSSDGQTQYPKNIIILFADGAASTQWEFGRYSSAVLRQQPFVTTDVVFKQGALGLASTYPHGAFVTDSAAAGSAMSTGFKVENGAVSVTPDGKPARTAMEVAKASGKRIGLVTTATVHDATPAAFSVHAKSRSESQKHRRSVPRTRTRCSARRRRRLFPARGGAGRQAQGRQGCNCRVPRPRDGRSCVTARN